MKNYTFLETIQSFYWDIVNFVLRIIYYIRSFNINYDSLYSDISKKWNEINSDLLKDKSKWNIVEEGNWGSARPDNISVSTPNNIIFNNDDNLTIVSQKEPNGVTGKDWNGNSVTRYYSSGCLSSKDLFYPIGKRFSLWCDIFPGLPTWPSFWIFYADERNVPPEERNYFEIDGFERFPNENKLTFTIHWDKNEKRKMYNHAIRYCGDCKSFLNCIVVDRGLVKIYINNILVFKTSLGYPSEEKNVCCIISDSLNDDKGNLTQEEIDRNLPINFHSKKLIIWEKK